MPYIFKHDIEDKYGCDGDGASLSRSWFAN